MARPRGEARLRGEAAWWRCVAALRGGAAWRGEALTWTTQQTFNLTGSQVKQEVPPEQVEGLKLTDRKPAEQEKEASFILAHHSTPSLGHRRGYPAAECVFTSFCNHAPQLASAAPDWLASSAPASSSPRRLIICHLRMKEGAPQQPFGSNTPALRSRTPPILIRRSSITPGSAGSSPPPPSGRQEAGLDFTQETAVSSWSSGVEQEAEGWGCAASSQQVSSGGG